MAGADVVGESITEYGLQCVCLHVLYMSARPNNARVRGHFCYRLAPVLQPVCSGGQVQPDAPLLDIVPRNFGRHGGYTRY